MIYTLGNIKPILPTDKQAYFVADNATVIGSVVLKENVSIWFNAVVRGDTDWITIGEGTNIQDGAVVHTDEDVPMTLGCGITVGHMAMLHGCTIGDYSLIGIKAVILNHARIGRHCLVGANTLIPEGKEYPDGTLIVGVPGRVKRDLTEVEIEGLKHSATHYVENFKRYQTQLQLLKAD